MPDVPDNERDRFEFLMSRWLDGDLPAEQAAELQRALRASGQLRAGFEQLRRVDELVRAWGRRELPVDWQRFQRAVVARAAGSGGATRRIRRAVRVFGPVAAAACVVLVAAIWTVRSDRLRGAGTVPVAQVVVERPASVDGALPGLASRGSAMRPVAIVRFDRTAPPEHRVRQGAASSWAAAVAVGQPRAEPATEGAAPPLF